MGSRVIDLIQKVQHPAIMQTVQKEIANFCQNYQLDIDPAYRLLDLVSELGEVSKEILKTTTYGKLPMPRAGDALKDEIGDVLFSLICLSNTLDVDMDSALKRALEKYKARLAKNGNPGSGA